MRHSFKPVLTLFLSGTLLSACMQNNTSSEKSNPQDAESFNVTAVSKTIRELTDRFTAAHIQKDTAYLNAIFTEDAKIFPPNSGIVSGKQAISQINTEYVNFGIHEFTETSVAIYGDENFVVDEGTYTLSYGNDNQTEKGKYLNVWKNVNGEWKMCSNIWNTVFQGNPAE